MKEITITIITMIIGLLLFGLIVYGVSLSDFCKDDRCKIETEYTLLKKQADLLEEIKLELDNNYGHYNNN